MTFGIRRFRALLFVSCASLVETNLLDCTDTMIMGHLLDDAALGALGLFWPCLEFICFVAMTIAGGSAIKFSEAIGVFDSKRSERMFSSGMYATLLLGALFAAGMFLGCDWCCRMLGAGPGTIGCLKQYWLAFSPNALLLPMSIYLATMVCADGGGIVCTAAFVAEFVVNAVASYFLCLRFGAAGCALGTVAGTVASLCVLPIHFFSSGNTLKLRARFSISDVAMAAKTDFSESSDMLFTGILYVFMNAVLVRKFGETALTVMAAVILANAFTYFLYGVAKAAQPIVGVYLGERDYPSVRAVMRDAARWSLLLGVSISAVLAAFPQIPVLLAGIDAPDLATRARSAVRIVAAGYFMIGIAALFVSYLIFIGRTRLSLALAFLQGAVCPLAGCLVGGAVGGERGFWFGYMLAVPVALALIVLWLVLRGEGGNLPFLLPHDRDGRIWTWNIARLDSAQACRVAQEVMAALKRIAAEPKHIVRAAMIVEDTLVDACDRNKGVAFSAEVTLDANDGVVVRFRDNGAVFEGNGTGDTGFRGRMLLRLGGAGNRNLVTTGFNRHEIRL